MQLPPVIEISKSVKIVAIIKSIFNLKYFKHLTRGASASFESLPIFDASFSYCSMYSRIVAPSDPVPERRKIYKTRQLVSPIKKMNISIGKDKSHINF